MLDRTLRAAAERWGPTPAYVATQGWAISYADLDRLAGEVAVGLAERGLAEGDVLGLVLPPTPEYLVAYLAAARLGAITAGVNARLTAGERTAVLARAGAAMVLATPALAPEGEGVVVVERATEEDDLLASVRVAGSDVPVLTEDPDRPVAIVFTSGTTGRPKGAVFAGRQLQAITDIDVGEAWGGGGTTMAGTSFAHLGPMTKLPGVLRRGGTTHLVDHWRAEAALALIERHRLSGIGGIPTQLALMLRHPRFEATDVSSVKAVVIGGGPATAALVREARERFGCVLSVRYSCTEAGIGLGTAFDAPPEDAEVSVGRPHAGVELTIRVERRGRGRRRGGRGVPPLPRRHDRLPPRPRGHPGGLHRRRGGSHRRHRLPRPRRAASTWSAGPRSATSEAATTSTPPRSSRSWPSTRPWPRSPSPPSPTTSWVRSAWPSSSRSWGLPCRPSRSCRPSPVTAWPATSCRPR